MRTDRRRLTWLVVVLALPLAWTSGCVRMQPIIVPVGEPVILLEPVTARVAAWVDGKLQPMDEPATIPAGWAAWYATVEDVRRE